MKYNNPPPSTWYIPRPNYHHTGLDFLKSEKNYNCNKNYDTNMVDDLILSAIKLSSIQKNCNFFVILGPIFQNSLSQLEKRFCLFMRKWCFDKFLFKTFFRATETIHFDGCFKYLTQFFLELWRFSNVANMSKFKIRTCHSSVTKKKFFRKYKTAMRFFLFWE